MATALITQTMNISGSGFYPNGTVQIVITASGGSVSNYNTTANASGAITMSITLNTITGITTAANLSMYAEDMTTTDKSNTVTISINNISVAPVIVAPSTPIQIITY